MKILRIIARLNVGGPARHVVWLTEGLKRDGYETLLVAGVVPRDGRAIQHELIIGVVIDTDDVEVALRPAE